MVIVSDALVKNWLELKLSITCYGLIYLRDIYLHSILRTIVLGPKTPLVNKLFCEHGCQPWRPAAMAPTIACDARTPQPST